MPPRKRVRPEIAQLQREINADFRQRGSDHFVSADARRLPTFGELDRELARRGGHATLAEKYNWTEKDVDHIDAALDEGFEQSDRDPIAKRPLDQISRFPSEQIDRRPRASRNELPNDHDLMMANRKLSDPSKYRHMNAREIAVALGISIKSVYEHSVLERFPTGTRKRLWTTESVMAVKNSPPE
jgi:hypothetical protein